MEVAAWFHSVFGDRYYIELQKNEVPEQRIATEGAMEVARRMGLPTVATNDTHYVDREDAAMQDLLLCINTGRVRNDPHRMRMEGQSYYLRSPGRDVRTVRRLPGRRGT